MSLCGRPSPARMTGSNSQAAPSTSPPGPSDSSSLPINSTCPWAIFRAASRPASSSPGSCSDEPTNDLDITSLDVLEESLIEFEGAVVLVTHDRFMLDRVCTEILGLDGNGRVGHYGDSAQWQAAQSQRKEGKSDEGSRRKPDS